MKQIDLLIIGQNYSTSLGLINSAGEAGLSVGVVHAAVCPVHHLPLEVSSKYVKDYLIITNRLDEQEMLLSIIMKFSSKYDKVVILPADDYSVGFIDRNVVELERYFIVPNINHMAREMIRCMDKSRQSLMAIDAGLSTARWWKIDMDKNKKLSIPSDIIYPCITKPLRSIGASKTYIKCCKSRSELESHLEAVRQLKSCSILVEEFLCVDNEYTVPILAIGDEVHIPAFIKKNRIGSGAHKGVTITGTVISSDPFLKVVNSMKRLVKNAGLQGIFDIELLQCDDSFFFNELNLRSGAAGYALTRAGINFPAMWVDYCHGKCVSINNASFIDGLSFVSDKAAIENYGSGYMNLNEYRKVVHSSDIRFIVDCGDATIKHRFRLIIYRTILSRVIKG